MSTIADFNRIDDCDKIDSQCIDAFVDFDFDPDSDTGICLDTSWGGNCLDLTDIVKAAETCTTLYLSPEENPNCLVYEPECGDNICINGDDLSRIISMQYLKDVTQAVTPSDGIVYMYNNTTKLFEPYDLKTAVTNINTAIQNINAAISNITNRLDNHETRLQTIEALLVPPANAPSGAKIAWGTINIYGDYGAVVDGSGTATSLDKTHGLYTHDLNSNVIDDQIMG